MPSGSIPTYAYKPPARENEPVVLRSCSTRRARLTAGGTYFRAREPGLQGNHISVEVIQVSEPTIGGGEAYCVIVNHNLDFKENVLGLIRPELLNLNDTTYQDLWIIDELDTPTPRTHYYSISCEIRNAMRLGLPYTLPTPTSIDGFRLSKLFRAPKISLKTAQITAPIPPSTTIFVTPRVRIYPLLAVSKTAEPTELGPGETTVGWDIEELRAQINSNDPWIEMPSRGTDSQDDKEDDDFLMPFVRTFLSGGDGLPANPNAETTGPFRSIVHVNYGERPDGSLGELNTIYEWVGDTSLVGKWVAY
jgi:hypothetical protein